MSRISELGQAFHPVAVVAVIVTVIACLLLSAERNVLPQLSAMLVTSTLALLALLLRAVVGKVKEATNQNKAMILPSNFAAMNTTR